MTTSTQGPTAESPAAPGSSWPRPELRPDQPAATATVAILEALFSVMLDNVEGVRAGLDAEPLHDFRVAVRRIRSVLREMRGVLPRKPAKRFRRMFSRLATMTGPTRDLDVFLLKLPAYEASLPADPATDLAPAKEAIEALRSSAHGVLVGELESDRFARLCREWPAFLDSTDPGTGPARGRHPIAGIVDKRIARARRRAAALAREIEPSSPGRDLHRLRLACKRLRYLQEVFRGLYPEDEITRRIETLKTLQDILGDFNDLAVQRETLRQVAKAHGSSSPATSAAVAGLEELLEELRQEDRVRVVRWVRDWESAVESARTPGASSP